MEKVPGLLHIQLRYNILCSYKPVWIPNAWRGVLWTGSGGWHGEKGAFKKGEQSHNHCLNITGVNLMVLKCFIV